MRGEMLICFLCSYVQAMEKILQDLQETQQTADRKQVYGLKTKVEKVRGNR